VKVREFVVQVESLGPPLYPYIHACNVYGLYLDIYLFFVCEVFLTFLCSLEKI
jgi:hypothetical protein